MDELSSDQAPQDINKEEFQLESVRLQAFVAATDPGCYEHTLYELVGDISRTQICIATHGRKRHHSALGGVLYNSIGRKDLYYLSHLSCHRTHRSMEQFTDT
ncbi:hypothetical protein TNCV_4435551 [Trichonephila clavipes]|nr:hypothetical protein TNCV_4435551 [Trichonephila clavipes]